MTHSQKKSKWRKILLWGCLLIIVAAIGLFFFLDSKTYEPSERAELAFQSDSAVTVSKVKDGFVFEPASGNAIEPNVVFYPGGLVKPEGYSPFARELAQLGHRVYIAKMPLNLALFGQNKADSFLKDHPDEAYVIGGHSLGGVFAARFALEHSDRLKGVYFMASYADQAMGDSGLSALQMTGSDDGVLGWEKWEEAKGNLPEDATFVSIEGGNHGQFGSYGKQEGDNDPSIGEEEQLQSVIAAMQDWFLQLTP